MKFKSIFLILISFCLSLTKVRSQTKNEFEITVSKSEFPSDALTYLSTAKKSLKRFRLYKETDNDKVSYEAKFKFDNRHFSVEFNTEGLLEDIEILIKKRHLPVETLKNIKTYLENEYTSFRFLKLQKQYKNTYTTNENAVLETALMNGIYSSIFYEVIAEVKSNKKRQLIELTFTEQGDFISSKFIVPEAYDYVLY